MKKGPIFCILMILFSFSFAMGQERNPVQVNPADPAFRAKFSNMDFNGKFYLLAITDAVNNYYMADFTLFQDKFERVYFINLIYQSGRIVNIDSDLSQGRVWFLANKKFSDKEVAGEFDQLRAETRKVSAGLTAEGKDSWMQKNSKFGK